MSIECLHSLHSLGLCAPLAMNSASACVLSLKLAGNEHPLLPAADLLEFVIVVSCLGFFEGSRGKWGVGLLFFFPKPSPSAMPWQCFGWGFFLASLHVLQHPRVCSWQGSGCAGHTDDAPAEKPWDGCPRSPTLSWDWSRDGANLSFVWKKAVQLSFASISCLFPRWGGGAGEDSPGPGGASAQRGPAGLCICSTAALAGVGSVPEGTFIATGRKRLICMTIAGFSWGVWK